MKTKDVCSKLPYRGFQLFIITGIFFSLFAFDVCGQLIGPFAPGRPTAVTVSVTGSTSLSVSWGPPASDGGSPITGYRVSWWRSGTTGVGTDRDVGATTSSYTISNLTAATSYEVQVRALNVQGASGEVQTTVTTGPAAPNAPTLTEVSTTSVKTSWTVPTGAGAIQYELQRNSTGVKGGIRTGSETTDTGLDATGGSYRARVRGGNLQTKDGADSNEADDYDWGDWSQWSATLTITPAAAPDTPAAPQVDAISSSTTSLRITWTAPNDNGAAITDYDVQYRVGSSGGFTGAGYNGTGTTTDITGLQPGTTYEVQVRATNSGGSSSWSTSGSGTTNSAVPDVPTITTVTALSATSLQVTWTAPNANGAAITGYDVQYRVGSSGGFTDAGYGGTALTTDITGLQAGTTYEVQVQATNSVGSSGFSTAGTGTTHSTVSDAPTITGVLALSTTSLRVTWTAPSNTGGAAITGYDVRHRVQGGSYGSWSDAGTGLTTVITGLQAGTTYEVQVRARNSVGTGSASTATGTTLSPGAPLPPNVQPSDNNPQTAFTLTWSTYTQGGQSATDYDLRYRAKNPGHWIDLPHDGTTTTTTLANLIPGTLYEIQIRAKTADGMSPWSSSAEGTTVARGVRVQPCPIGWHPWNHAQRTQHAFIHVVEVDMNLTDPRGAYQVVAIEIYVDLDTDPENLAGWKLRMAIPYNITRLEYLLTAENSEIIYFANPELGGIARIEVPEATPFPITNLTYIGQVLPGFDYRLFDENSMRVDFGVSCYREGGLTARLSAMQVPRVERKLKIADVDWQAPYYFSEWTVPGLVPAAPSAVKPNVVTSWGALKRQILEKE